jgi:hypothetical protein
MDEELIDALDRITFQLKRIANALEPHATSSSEGLTLADHAQILTNTIQDLTDNVIPEAANKLES